MTETTFEVPDCQWAGFHSTREWHDILWWLKFHGLDPDRIPVGSVIERDLEHRRVVTTYSVIGLNGRPKFDPHDYTLETETVHQQGETEPLPWPESIQEHSLA